LDKGIVITKVSVYYPSSLVLRLSQLYLGKYKIFFMGFEDVEAVSTIPWGSMKSFFMGFEDVEAVSTIPWGSMKSFLWVLKMLRMSQLRRGVI